MVAYNGVPYLCRYCLSLDFHLIVVNVLIWFKFGNKNQCINKYCWSMYI